MLESKTLALDECKFCEKIDQNPQPDVLYTVKSHFKALGLYNFQGGFGWAYKRGGGSYIRVGL